MFVLLQLFLLFVVASLLLRNMLLLPQCTAIPAIAASAALVAAPAGQGSIADGPPPYAFPCLHLLQAEAPTRHEVDMSERSIWRCERVMTAHAYGIAHTNCNIS